MRPFFIVLITFFAASQVYWLSRGHKLANKLIQAPQRRRAIEISVLAVYSFLFLYNFGAFGRGGTPTRLTVTQALLAAPFECWVASSLVAFLLVAILALPRLTIRGAAVLRRKVLSRNREEQQPASPARRLFLARATSVIAATPFAAGAYGAVYGRLDLETTAPRIRLPRLPRAFHGFRIAQLSDIHIGPFMTEEQIREYVAITNALKPDLIALTGDFVTWDSRTQDAVVRALSELKAPFGVYGCLGNHEAWSRTEDSITELFRQAGIRILRQEHVPVVRGADLFNLIGIDFARAQARDIWGSSKPLEAVQDLIAPDQVNILLSHNPATFDRAAELGIDLSLAGHTHGGQVALEFISPDLAPSRLMTPYVSGAYHKPGAQLYVNRGIGTIGVPIRLGARPEISVFELVREG